MYCQVELKMTTNKLHGMTGKIKTLFGYGKIMLITVIYVNCLLFLPNYQVAQQLCKSLTNVNLTLL
jgi:hypothetical protein